MVAELQEMVGTGVLKIVPDSIILAPVTEALAAVKPDSEAAKSSTKASLTAENDSLRLLLEQAEIDTKLLLAQAGIDAKEREAADKLQTAHSRGVASPHQEHAGDRRRHRLAKSSHSNQHRACAARDRRSSVRARTGA